jgi:RNA polymerase primary sigma factor
MERSERARLEELLIEILLGNPGKNKYELFESVKDKGFVLCSISDINSVMYGAPSVFVKNDNLLPLWKLSTETAIQKYKGDGYKNSTLPNLQLYKGHTPRAWQSDALLDWIQRGRRGVVEAVTGTGKTAVGILAAADALSRGLRVLILVPGVDLLEQWFIKLEADLPLNKTGKFGNGHKDTLFTHEVVVATVQSASKYNMLSAETQGLLIADEVHRYGTARYSLALEEAFNERLGLTATYERNDNGIAEHLTPYFSLPNKDVIDSGAVISGCGYARGLADGILAQFRVGLIGLNLELDEQVRYDNLNKILRRKRQRLIAEFGCQPEPFGEFIASVQMLSNCSSYNYASQTAQSYLRDFADRRKLLTETSIKLQAFDLLYYPLNLANHSLVFTETIESAINVAAKLQESGIKSEEFSSGISKDERKKRLEDFKNGKISVLCAPHVLDEGVDLPEADMGIILASTQTKRQMIQRMGRIIRPKMDGRSATFIIVYMKNTSEDPQSGAYEGFLNEVTDLAESIGRFDENTEITELLGWYIKGIGF